MEDANRRLPVLNEDPRGWEFMAWIQMVQVYHRVSRDFSRTLACHGVSAPQFDVLASLSTAEGITQQELAELLLVTKGNVVGLIDRMSAAGWVERREDPEDRRANRLYLTDAGRSLITRIFPVHLAEIRASFRNFNEAELRQLHALLGKIDAKA